MGFTPVKPFHHASHVCQGVSIDSFTSLARMLARPLLFGKKLILQVSHPRLLCALLIREHPAVFVTAVMSLFSESNAHCEVAEVLTMPKKYNP